MLNLILSGLRSLIRGSPEWKDIFASWNLKRVIDEAKHSVSVVCGLEDRVYARPWLRKSIEKASKRGVSFEILTGPEPAEKSLDALKAIEGSIKYLPERPLIHFAVVDRLHVRYEGIHPANTPTPSNRVAMNSPLSAEELMKEFAHLRAAAFREESECRGSCEGNCD